MPFTKAKCPQCGKVAESQAQYEIGKETVHLLKCKHIVRAAHLNESDISSIVSLDGKRPFPFQQEGVRFIEKSGGRALIADEMGLGKTVQALCTIALHDEMLPVAYFVKAGLKIQWQHEIMRWVSKSDGLGEDGDDDLAIAQVIDTPRDKILMGCKHFIFSLDILRRYKDGALEAIFEKRGIKTVVIDECQHIKNPDSQRSMQVRKLCKSIPNVIALSGTPIKNNASEYFSVLNILKPEMFPTYSKFIYNECQSYSSGFGVKVGGLKYPDRFMEKTKSFIIRRERKNVLPDLPQVSRHFHFDELSKDVEDAYKATFVQFRDDYFSHGASSFSDTSNTLAYLSRMRHLVGLSKIEPCVEFVEEFLESTDRKITIFVHHKDVAQILNDRLREVCIEVSGRVPDRIGDPCMLTADLTSQQRDEVIQDFKRAESRILIASTLASGEGLNLQFCCDCVLLERQWNPANEEQAEGRFIRIGQLSDKVTATYFVAVGTVDEFFSKIVEEKREICTKTMGGEAVKWNESSLMKELAEVLANSGGRAWSL